jgi:hypothetical protein
MLRTVEAIRTWIQQQDGRMGIPDLGDYTKT